MAKFNGKDILFAPHVHFNATEPFLEETYTSGNLTNVVFHGYTKIRKYLFYGCSSLALSVFPSNITEIETNAFGSCTSLAITSIPSSVDVIGSNAFYSCTGLTSITFSGTPSEISSTAFRGCTNLTTINVPWDEDEVANAPWGATNATINYNYSV